MAKLKNQLMKNLHPRLAQAPYKGARRLVVSVSGGVDSMVLLDVLRRMALVHAADLEILHIHHHTGAFADAAQQLVEDYGRRYEIPVTVAFYKHEDGNFEHRAAAFRREALAQRLGDGVYGVLGHHQGDQAETLLLALSRGTSMGSPIGMHLLKGHRARPLLDQSKQAILDYAKQFEVPFLDDPSNEDVSYFRNRIRHEVLPRLNDHHRHSDTRLAAFVMEYEQMRSAMAMHGKRLFEQYYVPAHGLLKRVAFEDSEDYLWPMILDGFWGAHGLAKPQRKEFSQILTWLKEGDWGHFKSKEGRSLWVDLDGLCVIDDAPVSLVVEDEAIVWGPWSFRLAGAKGCKLQTVAGLSKPDKEFLRLNKVPMRFRRAVPEIIRDDQALSIIGLLRAKKQVGYQLFLNQDDLIYEYL